MHIWVISCRGLVVRKRQIGFWPTSRGRKSAWLSFRECMQLHVFHSGLHVGIEYSQWANIGLCTA